MFKANIVYISEWKLGKIQYDIGRSQERRKGVYCVGPKTGISIYKYFIADLSLLFSRFKAKRHIKNDSAGKMSPVWFRG